VVRGVATRLAASFRSPAVGRYAQSLVDRAIGPVTEFTGLNRAQRSANCGHNRALGDLRPHDVCPASTHFSTPAVTRLKIVVSSVRFRVSPLPKALQNLIFLRRAASTAPRAGSTLGHTSCPRHPEIRRRARSRRMSRARAPTWAIARPARGSHGGLPDGFPRRGRAQHSEVWSQA
jgi:hypothetical protein